MSPIKPLSVTVQRPLLEVKESESVGVETKRALITGASEGLGRTFAKRLASEGYDTTSVARNEDRLANLISELGDTGQHDYIVADLSRKEEVTRIAQHLQQHKYHLLINNAGFSRFGTYEESDFEDEGNILLVNCYALMALAHAFLKTSVPGDAMINLSSVGAFMPTPIQSTYTATKAFNASLSESLWYQQRDKGVYIQGLCPGYTKTEFFDRAGGETNPILERSAQTPEQVIDASIKALKKRKKSLVIPGLGNRIVTVMSRLIPRQLLVIIFGKLGAMTGVE